MWDTKLIYKNLLHFHTLVNREIKKKIWFTIPAKRAKYLEKNLAKEVKNLYSENYRTLLKEIEGDSNKWKGILCSWGRRINIVNMTTKPKAISDSMQSLPQNE